MAYIYLIGAAIYAVLWFCCFLFREDLRGKMLVSSLFAAALGLSEAWFVPAYWVPQFQTIRLLDQVYLGTILFAFFLGGVVAVLYQVVFNHDLFDVKSLNPVITLVAPLLTSAYFFRPFNINVIYYVSAPMILVGLIILYYGRVKAKAIIYSSVLNTALYAVLFLVIWHIFPELSASYQFGNLSGFLLAGVPIEEFMWILSVSIFWTPLYEIWENHLKGGFGLLISAIGVIFALLGLDYWSLFFLLGMYLMSAYFGEKFYDESYLSRILDWKFVTSLIAVGLSVTLAIELFETFIADSWLYAFDFYDFSFWFWFSMVVYVLFIPASFEVFNLVSHVFGKESTEYRPLNKQGFFLLAISFILASFLLSFPSYPGLPLGFFIVGLFLLIDWASYVVCDKSVLSGALSSVKYASAVVVASLMISVPYESVNLLHPLWEYVNHPFLNIELAGVPVYVIIGWIPLVSIWINSYHLSSHLRLGTSLFNEVKSYKSEAKDG